MRHFAVITPGVLPVPCSLGGAVETLVEFYLQENEKCGNYFFHVFSIYDERAEEMASKYKHSKFYFFHPHDFLNRLRRYRYIKHNSRLYYDGYMDYYGYWALRQIQKMEVDLLIVENRQGFLLNDEVDIRCPKILHLHNDTLNADSAYAREILDNCDRILTVSGYIKRQVDSIADTDKVRVVYNGIDVDRFLDSRQIYDRKYYGLSDDDFVVVYAGRISPIKGIRELLQAFLLLKDYPNIKLMIVGGSNYGEKTFDPFFEEVMNIAREIWLQVVFTGYIPYENIPSILKLGDIAVIPSVCEDAFTLSSVESMACGLPLIVTRSGGIPEAVDEQCAVILEKDKNLVESLARSIIHISEQPENLRAMSEHGMSRCRRFDKQVYISNVYSMLNEMTKA